MSICRALDGVPLAIELAAARVRVLSAEQISARLDDRFGLLTGGDRSAAPRQHTLRATIEWSYDLLTAQEQALFRRLSVLPGWSLEMAEQVCSDEDIPAHDVLGLVAALVDKSLVVPESEVLGQMRFRMLDTIREYAATRLAEAGESAAFAVALRDYTLRTAERNLAIGMARVAAPWQARVDVFRQYDAETSTVFQVLNWCLAQADVQTGLRICIAVSPCWIVWGTFAESGEWLDKFLALDSSAVPAGVQGAAMVVRAQLALSSDPAAAELAADEGLRLCRRGGRGVLDRGRAEPAQRDRPAYGAARARRGLRGRSTGGRPGHRGRMERGLRSRYPGGGRGPAGQAPRGPAADQRLGQRHAPHRPAVGRRPGPARPG